MFDLVEKLVKSPEVVDCTHAPSFGMSRRNRVPSKLFNAAPTVTATATPPPSSTAKTNSIPFNCQFKLANRKTCNRRFDNARGTL